MKSDCIRYIGAEKATERRKDREAERIKNALYSKDLQGRNEGEEKGKQDREQRA